MTRPLPPPLLIRLLVILNYDTYVTAYSESFPFTKFRKVIHFLQICDLS